MADKNAIKRLILIDGSSFLYRAYYAVKQNFTTKEGIPTGATFIITRMFRNLLDKFMGDKFVVVFDAKGPSFRREMYAEYKATRPPMPDDLRAQIDAVHSITEAMGFPLVSVQGVEADDVLGSYTRKAQELGMEVIICTGDKDLAQLVQPGVSILDTMRDTMFDAAMVQEKYGVPPEHIVDFLALKGDSSDNIPGMKGVGDKTAVAVILALGGVFDIKEHLDNVKDLKFRGASTFAKRFMEQWPEIELSYRLATIKCDVELPIAIEDLPYPKEDNDTLIALFERLEFHRFAAEQRVRKLEQEGKAASLSATTAPAPMAAAASAAAAPTTAAAANTTSPAEAGAVDAADADTATKKDSPAAEDAILIPQKLRRRGRPSLAEKQSLLIAAGAAAATTETTTAATDDDDPDPIMEALAAKRLQAEAATAAKAADADANADANTEVQTGTKTQTSTSTSTRTKGTAASNKKSGMADILDISKHRNHGNVNQYLSSFKVVTTTTELRDMIRAIKAAPLFAFYLEESSSHTPDSSLIGAAFSLGDGASYYVPLRHSYIGVDAQLPATQAINALRTIFEKEDLPKACYDVKLNRLYLHFLGIELKGYVADPLIMAHIIDSSRAGELINLAQDFLEYVPLNKQHLSPEKVVSIAKMDIDVFKDFACEQALLAYKLYEVLISKIANLENGKTILDHEMQVLDVLFDMESIGALLDGRVLTRQARQLKEDMYLVQEDIFDLAGHKFNISSPKQLSKVLFEELAIPYPRKTQKFDKNGNRSYSTADDVLNEIGDDYDIIRKIQRYRMLSKLVSTYADKLPLLISPRTGRIHTCFNLAGTVTGRLSSSDPNLQNIPARTKEGKQIRGSFVAPEGYHIVSADYSQIELRLIAHFSQDQNLIEAFHQHQDIHRVTAAEVLGKNIADVTDDERKHAKATNFGLMYGMSAHGLSKQTGMSYADAKNYIERYFDKYPSIKAMMDKVIAEAKQHGYVTTLLGNRVFIKGINSTGMGQRTAERAAINAPMQGSAADIIKKAMVEVNAYIKTLPKDSVHMTLQVHDELVFEVRDDLVDEFCTKVKEIMEHVVSISVPLEVGIGIGVNWAEAH